MLFATNIFLVYQRRFINLARIFLPLELCFSGLTVIGLPVSKVRRCID